MENCIFCKIAQHKEKAWMVHETKQSCAFFSIFPMNPYHTLVIPKNHFENIFDIPTEELKELMSTLKYVIDIYSDKLKMKHIQIISSNGTYGQQDVFHLHFHIAPRHENDGQNIKWKTSGERTPNFDSLLSNIGIGKKIEPV